VNFVDDPELAHADAPRVLIPFEFLHAIGSGIRRKDVDTRPDAVLNLPG
jgi:hypothetical protein